MKKIISILLILIIIFSCFALASCNSIIVGKYVEEGKIDLRNLLNDSTFDEISSYLGEYTQISKINDNETIEGLCNMLLNDIEIETDEAKIHEFKSFVKDNYGHSVLSLYFKNRSETMVSIKLYDKSHIYISAMGKEFVSYTSCATNLDQMYKIILSNRLEEKPDTTQLNTQFSLIDDTTTSILMYSSSKEFIGEADPEKIASVLDGELMIYVPKYDFIHSSEALFHSYEYLKCKEQIDSGILFVVQYQNGSESFFYLGDDNKIYYLDESGNMFVLEK